MKQKEIEGYKTGCRRADYRLEPMINKGEEIINMVTVYCIYIQDDDLHNYVDESRYNSLPANMYILYGYQ